MNSFLSFTLGIGVATLLGLFFATNPAKAETLDTQLFSVSIPEGCSVSRNVSGLWEIVSSEPFEQRTTLLLSRLLVDVETYLQGTSKLWQTLGEVEYVAGPEQYGQNLAHFLIRSPEDSSQMTSKHVVWNQDRLLVVTSTFPVKHSEPGIAFATGFTKNIVVKDAHYEPARLRGYISENLTKHHNSAQELSDLSSVRREMASFRQDWESIVGSEVPAVFTAYRDYLEARYDAAFVLARGEELGMPEGLFDARLQSVENRKQELLRALDGLGSSQGL